MLRNLLRPSIAHIRNSPFCLRRLTTQNTGDNNKDASIPDDKKDELGPMSFIERAKIFGANAIMGMFKHNNGFDRTMEGLKVERLGEGKVVCSMEVTKSVSNAYGTLHGGAISTLIDIVGTMALVTIDPTKAGVSVELNISFLSSAKIGERIILEGKTLKSGKRLGFTDVSIKRESDGQLIAVGRHTKAL